MDMSKIERDNALALHALTAPFRWLRNFIIGAFTLLFALSIFTYNSLFWVVGLGTMGWIDRQEAANRMFIPDDDNRRNYADYWISFDRRSITSSSGRIDYSTDFVQRSWLSSSPVYPHAGSSSERSWPALAS